MVLDDQLENQFRRFTIEKLQVLHAIISHSSPVVSSEWVSTKANIKDRELGGVLSSLSRSKVDNEPLILPVARSSSEGMIWRFNESIVSRKQANDLVEKILKEIEPYLQLYV